MNKSSDFRVHSLKFKLWTSLNSELKMGKIN